VRQAHYEANIEKANQLGITKLRLIGAFPLILASVGYSRVYAAPQPDAALRPFITNRPRIPIYTIRNTTEAFMFEMDPWREAAWLIENGLTTGPQDGFASETHLRLWLLYQRGGFARMPANPAQGTSAEAREFHLLLEPWERDAGLQIQNIPAALFGLLHSVSHMLIMAGGAQIGFETDSLAEYLFHVAGSGVIYASGHQEFTIGGIVSAFNLNLNYWLSSAYEAAARCIYNPLCRSRGGACHACSYLKFSCPHFNRTVSRSFLLGGPVEGLPQELTGYWTPKIANLASQLKQQTADRNLYPEVGK
jgi:hypothetical protein